MSFTEVLNELSTLSVEQRQLLMSRVLELDDSSLSTEDEILIKKRLAAHHQNPTSSVPLAKMKDRLQNRFRE